MKTMVSAIQPTSDLTLGNYLGAIANFVSLQDEYKNIIFIADLHAFTNDIKIGLESISLNIIKTYLACGLDVKKTILFKQSDIMEHTYLAHILLCNTTMGELTRMTQFKDKSSKVKNSNGTESIPAGLLTYPVLMASDILLYNADVVIVGSDQKQHIELTRNLASRINNKLNKKILTIPEPYISKLGSKIMDLQDPNKKMSKSNENKKGIIFLNDSAIEVEKKIKSALTDNFNTVKYDLINQPGVSNLLTIYSKLSGMEIKKIEEKYIQISNYGVFKNNLIVLINDLLFKIQNNASKISDLEIKDILNKGKIEATKIAKQNLDNIKKELRL